MRAIYRSVLVVASLAWASAALAVSIPWINVAGGDFSNSINWLTLSVPGTNDVALFNTGFVFGYTTTLSANITNSQMFVAADRLSLDLQGHNYTLGSISWVPGNYSLQVGSALGGSLNLTNSSSTTGTLNTQYDSIAVLPGDIGSMTVAGAHTAWTAAKSIYVGDGGNGTLNITNGAGVSDLIASVGNTATGSGNVTVDGAGSSWNSNDYFYVGAYGNGSLTIQNGGHVNGSVTYIGQYAHGTASVTGPGSSLTAQYLDIAYQSSGSLNITNGASVTDSDAYVSSAVNSPGMVTVSGTNSTWTNTDTLYVGVDSAAVVNINTGGLVSVAKTFGISNKPGTQVNLAGGTLRVGYLNTAGNPSLFLGDGVSTGWTSGTLDITFANLSLSSLGALGSNLTLGPAKTLRISGASATLTIASGSSLNVAGGTVYASALNNAGSLSLPNGSSVEVVNPLVNTGLIDISGGTLQLDSGVSGSTVQSLIASGYDHGNWDGTTGITSTAAAGDPANATAVGYSTSGSTTKVFYTWYGDANGDGVVNSADAFAMSSTGTTWQTGDFNYDGVVNEDDWSLFFLGSLYGSNNISTLLPEPMGLAMLLPMAGLMRRRR